MPCHIVFTAWYSREQVPHLNAKSLISHVPTLPLFYFFILSVLLYAAISVYKIITLVKQNYEYSEG